MERRRRECWIKSSRDVVKCINASKLASRESKVEKHLKMENRARLRGKIARILMAKRRSRRESTCLYKLVYKRIHLDEETAFILYSSLRDRRYQEGESHSEDF